MCSCWQDNPDNRPTFETLYMRFDEFMIQAEPSYREVKHRLLERLNTNFPFLFRRELLWTSSSLSEPIRYIYSLINADSLLRRLTNEFCSFWFRLFLLFWFTSVHIYMSVIKSRSHSLSLFVYLIIDSSLFSLFDINSEYSFLQAYHNGKHTLNCLILSFSYAHTSIRWSSGPFYLCLEQFTDIELNG